jgi:hypothetical protein
LEAALGDQEVLLVDNVAAVTVALVIYLFEMGRDELATQVLQARGTWERRPLHAGEDPFVSALGRLAPHCLPDTVRERLAGAQTEPRAP